MESRSDEELMALFCAGNDQGFQALFERHAGKVRSFLTRMVKDEAQAEDLLQATFLSVIRSRGRFERGMKFVPWLLTIAANAARDNLRHRKYVQAHMQAEQAEPREAASSASGDPGLRRRLDDALQQLPVSQREAVVLHKVEGWNFEEISEALGISPTAARIRAHRGYERLRELLQDLEEA